MPLLCARFGIHSHGNLMAVRSDGYNPVVWKPDMIFLGVRACTQEGREVELGHLSPRINDKKLVTNLPPRNLKWPKDSLTQCLGQIGAVGRK